MSIWRWVSVEKCIGEIVQRSVWNQFQNSVPHICLQINSTITQPFSMSPICPSWSLKNHQIREAPKKWYFLGIFLYKFKNQNPPSYLGKIPKYDFQLVLMDSKSHLNPGLEVKSPKCGALLTQGVMSCPFREHNILNKKSNPQVDSTAVSIL